MIMVLETHEMFSTFPASSRITSWDSINALKYVVGRGTEEVLSERWRVLLTCQEEGGVHHDRH